MGNGLGNNAVFSLNMWLRTIYYLQTIHEPACVILTLFNILTKYLVYAIWHYGNMIKDLDLNATIVDRLKENLCNFILFEEGCMVVAFIQH